MRFEPGVPWPAPPLWRSLYLGLYLVSNPPEKRDAMLLRRVIVALLSSQSVLLSLFSSSLLSRTQETERKERMCDESGLSFFFFEFFFPLFFCVHPFQSSLFFAPLERERRDILTQCRTPTTPPATTTWRTKSPTPQNDGEEGNTNTKKTIPKKRPGGIRLVRTRRSSGGKGKTLSRRR